MDKCLCASDPTGSGDTDRMSVCCATLKFPSFAGTAKVQEGGYVTCRSPIDSTELLDPVYHLGCRQSNPAQA